MRVVRAVIAGILCVALFAGCTMVVEPGAQADRQMPQIEPEAGQWGTFVLNSGDELRPAAPPEGAATVAEIEELQRLAGERDSAVQDSVDYWDAGSPSYRWNQIALDRITSGHPGPPVSHAMSLVNVAIYDATVATWDAKYAYDRARPAQQDASLSTMISTPASPSYPSVYAASAAAAATVLGYLFPDDAALYTAKAEEAGQSRMLAGVSFPSDVDAGLALGRAVGEKVVEWAKTDGSDAVWDGQVPTGPDKWQGDNPAFPLAGTWRTWVLTSGDQLRPPAPPAYDSAEIRADIAEIESITRTLPIVEKTVYWGSNEGGYNYWYDLVSLHLFERGLDRNPPYAARVYAALAVADHDAIVACFDTKYAYWFIRPNQLDSTVTTLIPTPPHPSYPAGASCGAGAFETVVASYFPTDADVAHNAAEETGLTRIWAGIHYRNDVEVGRKLGQDVAQLVLERIQQMTHS